MDIHRTGFSEETQLPIRARHNEIKEKLMKRTEVLTNVIATTIRHAWLVIAVVVLLLGCGGGGNEDETSAEPTPTLRADTFPDTGPEGTEAQSTGRKAAAAASNVDPVLGYTHVATWAYFRDPAQKRWFISQTDQNKSDVFSLGFVVNRQASWWLAGESSATVDSTRHLVSIDRGLLSRFPGQDFWALVGSSWVQMNHPMIVEDRRAIQGANTPIDWYFFRARDNRWYIVNATAASGGPLGVYRFALAADGRDYDWRHVDVSGYRLKLTASRSGVRVEFVREPVKFIWPTALPEGVELRPDTPADQIYNTSGWGYLEDTGQYYTSCTGTDARVSNHPGIDINIKNKGGNDDENEPILAVADGTVKDVDVSDGAVTIAHTLEDGKVVWSAYRHMKNISVDPSDTVTRGSVIGLMSSVGGDFTAHLHFEIRTANHPDPAKADFWCGYEGISRETMATWLADPLAFISARAR